MQGNAREARRVSSGASRGQQERLCIARAIAVGTRSMQQAARVSQRTTFFHLGKPIEYGATEQVVSRPQQKQTGDDISGRIG